LPHCCETEPARPLLSGSRVTPDYAWHPAPATRRSWERCWMRVLLWIFAAVRPAARHCPKQPVGAKWRSSNCSWPGVWMRDCRTGSVERLSCKRRSMDKRRPSASWRLATALPTELPSEEIRRQSLPNLPQGFRPARSAPHIECHWDRRTCLPSCQCCPASWAADWEGRCRSRVRSGSCNDP